ncbi:MAG: glycosyltransferase family 2 protein [Trichloromonadaceae bacterium]
MGSLFWISLFGLLCYSLIALEVLPGSRRIPMLRQVAPRLPCPAPKVSLIAAARNEERNLNQALQSLLRLDYPNLELILVDDRSEDATGAILDRLVAEHPQLQVLHIEELPPGWLGKNHALWLGSRQAAGELLLFTDADVVFAPEVLQHAVTQFQSGALDHLALTPDARMPSAFLNMFGLAFGLIFAIFTRPWRAGDPSSPCHIGIGAFNLVRAEAYRQVGGHRTIALRPDDDLKLGKILKRAGYRQQLLYGSGLIAVEWYASVSQLIRGLEKNAFAGTDYRIWLALGGAAILLLSSVWPYAALLLTQGPSWWLALATVALINLLLINSARRHGSPPWHALGFPLAAALFAFIIVRTTLLNLWQGGITWRGTFYSLEELRRNRV